MPESRGVEVGVRTIVLPGLVLLCACMVRTGSPPPAVPLPDNPPPSATADAVALGVLAEVNDTRKANGVHALRRDAALELAAREHAEELAVRRTLDHASSDPARRTMTMRIDAAGGSWSRAAENLASMSGPASGVPSGAVQMWLSSAGHRRNMLERVYTHTGVGIALDRHGIWYVTQLYVLPQADR